MSRRSTVAVWIFRPALKVLSTVLPGRTFLTLVRTKAGPLPGLTLELDNLPELAVDHHNEAHLRSLVAATVVPLPVKESVTRGQFLHARATTSATSLRGEDAKLIANGHGLIGKHEPAS